MGQMVRGGRSCPSDKKLGGGAEWSESLTVVRPGGSGSNGTELTNGVSAQKAEHMLHLSEPAWS